MRENLVLLRIRMYAVRLRFLSMAYVAVAVTVLTCFSPAHAASSGDWTRAPFQYVAVDQSLRDVLHELSIATAVPIKVSDLVSGQAHGLWPNTTAGEFLSQLAKTYALEWYFDGSLLSVSALSEDETRLVSLHGAGLEKLRDGLTTAGLMDARFALRAGPTPDVALVSGPPRFLAIVQQSVDAITASGTPTQAMRPGVVALSPQQELKIFRGSHISNVMFR